ncbi:valine--pyruvate transaminase [Agarivorans sp. 1_MG-2023]|uniref:valine--pyruvate transaminase n=1 Tax=Agarivorans sp. 1_MG-2023 TaxID=3062634 RepID=UPI0026E34BFD|nr:valine--pyruvate transaminase [Agarivorans sp. 1_MG-2023]MDO6764197.1 valine--pyruvate transaminase [Agarivorans sp. 1_MG-2023]
MTYSDFGNKFTRHAGITQLMDDLDEGIRAGDEMIMLGGGNPAQIPEMTEIFEQHLRSGLDNKSLLNALCNYDAPQGNKAFISNLAEFLSNEFHWDIKSENIALTNGSQSAFFYLFNLFAGKGKNSKKVLFPLAPEYIGYEDSGIDEDLFIGNKPNIEYLDKRQFKYHVDFDHLHLDQSIGLVCVSRPTNPTGNVITDDEISKLSVLAKQHGVPLLIDNAYGLPFPNLVFTDEATPFWDDNTILCLSLSKLGLPGTRCGIVIAKPETIKAVSNLSGIINLSPGGVGPALANEMLKDNSLLDASNNIIRPFYQRKSQQAIDWLQAAIPSTKFRIHKSEGAMFLWLWFEGLAISDKELYQALKQKGLLIVPGSYFFPGVSNSWRHTQECIRLNFAQSEANVKQGIEILASVVNPLLEA